MTEENQKTKEITTEENSVSALPKQEVVEPVPIVEETSIPTETAPIEQVEVEPKQEEIPEVVETSNGEIPVEETQEEIIAEIPQIEEVPQVEETQPQLVQQEQPQTQQPQIQTVEKIIYQTPPNLIQNLLNKARAKIQERKRNKLDKIMSLFESNPDISNSDIQNLLRTTKRSATRYLDILEKEQKIIQVGNAGRSVKYIKKP
ncbi:hypothetical protein KKC45_02725 [Patescibacteria group bacterium]|nr:hypothetical protein [Patescibacteria group bacterium]